MTLDANIVIDYLGGDFAVIELLDKYKNSGIVLILPTVSESEILSFSKWTAEERKTTQQFLEENFTSIPFDRSIARVAAEIRRTTRIKFPDAAIAATALFTHTPLVTRNQKDFKRISGLEIISI